MRAIYELRKNNTDGQFSKLVALSEQLKEIEAKANKKRIERDQLALKILASGKFSLREVAKKAGISNVRLIQIRDKNAKSV